MVTIRFSVVMFKLEIFLLLCAGSRKYPRVHIKPSYLYPGDIWGRPPVPEFLRLLHLLPGRDHRVQALRLPPGSPGEHGLLNRDAKGLRHERNVSGIEKLKKGEKLIQ